MPIWLLIAAALLVLVIFGAVSVVRMVSGPNARAVLGTFFGIALVLMMGWFFVGVTHDQGMIREATVHQMAAEVEIAEHARFAAEAGRNEARQPPPVDDHSQPDLSPAPAPPTIPLDEHGESIPVLPRPAWIDSPGEIEADGTVVTIVHTDPQANASVCLHYLNDAIRSAARSYAQGVAEQQGSSRYVAHRLPPHQLWHIAQLARPETYTAPFESSAGTMVQMHARLRFTPQIEQTAAGMMHSLVMSQRMAAVMLGGVLLLSGIGAVFGYLRLDTATKGYYTWRLRAAAAAAFGAVFVATIVVSAFLGLDDNVMFGP